MNTKYTAEDMPQDIQELYLIEKREERSENDEQERDRLINSLNQISGRNDTYTDLNLTDLRRALVCARNGIMRNPLLDGCASLISQCDGTIDEGVSDDDNDSTQPVKGKDKDKEKDKDKGEEKEDILKLRFIIWNLNEDMYGSEIQDFEYEELVLIIERERRGECNAQEKSRLIKLLKAHDSVANYSSYSLDELRSIVGKKMKNQGFWRYNNFMLDAYGVSTDVNK